MKYNKYNSFLLLGLMAILFHACKKDGNPNHLPGVSPADYADKIDGYTSSDEINPKKLVAYWSFDDSKNELKTNTAPTQTLNDALVSGGVRGKALNLNGGYLYFAKQFDAFKTDALKSWSISVWAKLKNNGSKRTMLLQLAEKDVSLNGNINFLLNTQSYPATNDSVLRIQPTFRKITGAAGAVEDNLNSILDKTNLNNWNHIVLTYDITTGVFNIWLNGVKVGNFPNRGTTNLFNSYEPNEFIIGSNYNGIPGKIPGSDAAVAPMTGMVDELRIFNESLKDDYIKALYKLGLKNL
ncbi:LamG-like jellyroll fold domain-containing protein [Niabella sp.]|uniref:LamG-like jellyroll fold domain-containing protein n=1 Tax=Niabella sp. TaxID=1962976 RepID=UPI00262C90BC|nr:LamG-like jellyroll fold domain-containing protein [Niabella sp.]